MENNMDPNKKKKVVDEGFIDERSPEPMTRVEKDNAASESESTTVVNEQEQNRIVNPSGEDFRDDPLNQFVTAGGGDDDDDDEDDEEIIDPDEGAEIETPHLPEGDDADDVKKKIPTMAMA